jgi:MarR family transcriptional regulator, transcriptional regulator for hemolysin
MPMKADPNSVGFLINDVARIIRSAFEKRINEAGLGITPGEARALLHAATCGGFRQTAIADRMGIEPMTLCAYLDRLEKLDLISRTPDETDRRAKLIYATDDAAAMVSKVRYLAKDVVDKLQQGVDAESRELVRQALIKMRDNQSLVFGDEPAAQEEKEKA